MPEEPVQNVEVEEEEEGEPTMSFADAMGWRLPEEAAPQIGAEKELEDVKNAEPYEVWKREPTPTNLYNVTRQLQPTISSVLASMGAAGNPQLEAKARVVAGKAVASYDPKAGASLPTWVSSQLRQLTRDVRKSDSAIQVPDRMMLDAYAIHRAEAELEDELGHEPTVEELADRSHLSVRRIEDCRKKMKAVIAGTPTDPATGEEVTPAGKETDYSREAMDYIYADSDRIDKKLLEYTAGYGGNDPLGNDEIMKKLNLTPVQLSRRKTRLALRMKQIIEDLEDVTNS